MQYSYGIEYALNIIMNVHMKYKYANDYCIDN